MLPAVKKANRNSNFDTFSASEKDFRNSDSFETYFDKIEKAAKLMHGILKEKKYLVVMLRDSYQKRKYIPAGFEVSRRIGKYFVFKGVKNQMNKESKLCPLILVQDLMIQI